MIKTVSIKKQIAMIATLSSKFILQPLYMVATIDTMTSTKKTTKKIKKQILAINDATPATPVNPNAPAIKAITNAISPHVNIALSSLFSDSVTGNQ